jgi:hypothetical protein
MIMTNKDEHIESEHVGKICMVRTYSAGVFYGTLEKKVGKEEKKESTKNGGKKEEEKESTKKGGLSKAQEENLPESLRKAIAPKIKK